MIFQKKISLIVSFMISVVSLILFIVFLLLSSQKIFFLNALGFFVASFLFVFFLIESVNRNFIFERLSEILESLVMYRNHSESRKKFPLGEDVIEDIKEEVKGWADDRKNETERLKKLELYRKEYIGNVSHELKTPVFNIQGYILTLLDGGLEDKNVNRNYLERAEKSVERMTNIIEDLESISQLETGELVLEMEPFDIVALAKDVCESQEMNAASKGIIFSIKREEPVLVFADRFRIRQVLTNLIVNSVKYGKEHGETSIKISEARDLIKIEVSDNGIGIGEEYIPRLYERFYRVDKSRSRDQGGTGLGLSIVKHILEAHGYSINAASKLGEGTTFSFTLRRGVNT